jgi:hypothetical protein
MHYRVIWEIDVDAESPRAAACRALDIQRNPDSIATVFQVVAEGGEGEIVDLLPDDCE